MMQGDLVVLEDFDRWFTDRWSTLVISFDDYDKVLYEVVKNELSSCIDDVTTDVVKEMRKHNSSNHEEVIKRISEYFQSWDYKNLIDLIVNDNTNHIQVDFINQQWELELEEYTNTSNKKLLKANQRLLKIFIELWYLESEKDLAIANFDLLKELWSKTLDVNNPDDVFQLLELFDRVIPVVFSDLINSLSNKSSYAKEMWEWLRKTVWFNVTDKQYSEFLEYCSKVYLSSSLEERIAITSLIWGWI